MKSLQDTYAPSNSCFGCGPANSKGLQIKSFPEGDELVCRWHAQPHHQAFEGMLNGGIAGALLDCHSNWTAIHAIMVRDGRDEAPCCVTAEFKVTMLNPIPTVHEIVLRASPSKVGNRSVHVHATLAAADTVCATCDGVFVEVKEGHPAFQRW